MKEYINRLIKCGMQKDIAMAICRSFERDNDFDGIKQYVELIEEKVKGDEEEW